MRISPLALTMILAVLTGVVAIAIWVPLSGHFYPTGTPEMANNTTATVLAGMAKITQYTSAAQWVAPGK